MLALVAGLVLGLIAPAGAGPRSSMQGFFLVSLGAVSCAWLWLDARERKHTLRPSYFVGLLLAPVVAVPFYFNQSRERAERVKANLWFVVVAISTVMAFLLGAALVSVAK